jgi:type IV pilus assembly protein PilV
MTRQLIQRRLNASMSQQMSSQHGFTLLEVLVAIVILSIGLLGLAGLQAVSLNNNQIAYYRSIASQQTYDMADRIRANLAGVTAGNYDNLPARDTANPNDPPDPGCINGNSGCSTALANVALTDRFQWLTNTAVVLPGGAGTVRCVQGPASTCVTNTATANRVFDITVTWTEKSQVGTATQNFVTRFAP